LNEVVLCPQCGAKVRAGHRRCPRCREKLLGTASGFDFGRVAPIALGLLFIAALVSGFAFWRQAGEHEEAPAARAVVESPSSGSASHARPIPRPRGNPVETEIAFIEPSRAGGVAYNAGDYAGALAQYQDAVRAHPEDAESWSNLGQVLVRLNRAEEAVPHFQHAIGLNGGRWAYHFNLARALGLMGKWPQAAESYRAAQRLYPEDYAIAFNLGLALRKSGDEEGAIEQFRNAIALDPGDPTFHFSLAVSCDRLGRAADAVQAYQRTLELAPDAPEVPQIRARIEALLN
jgi:Flp pilus assembly protein TadD